MDNYPKLIERIANSSNLSAEEIERKVEAKRAKLSYLVSKEGAAQIVAAELGINFDNERLKLSELAQGIKRVNVIGKIIKLDPVREFNKSGRQGKVANLWIADETSNARVVLWDTNHISMIENKKIKEGDNVEILNANLRNGEIHLSAFAELKPCKEKIENPIMEKRYQIRKLRDVRIGEIISTRAFVVQAFEPKYFEVHPETGRKLTEEDIQNNVKPVKRALLSITLDDGTDAVRSVLFGEQINSLGLTDKEIFSIEEFNKIKNTKVMGEEKIFDAQVRSNQLTNLPELTIQSIKEINPEELLKELEARS